MDWRLPGRTRRSGCWGSPGVLAPDSSRHSRLQADIGDHTGSREQHFIRQGWPQRSCRLFGNERGVEHRSLGKPEPCGIVMCTIKKIRGTQAVDDLATCRRGAGANAGTDGDAMPNIVDGSFDTPEGRKVFVSRRTGESAEHFAQRAMAILQGAPSRPKRSRRRISRSTRTSTTGTSDHRP
jgi:hypothetical protein